MQKKGWLIIVEAVIAVLILFGFLFAAIARQQTKPIETNLHDIANELARKAEDNETIRNAVLEGTGNEENENIVKENLAEMLSKMQTKKTGLDACICDLDENCPTEQKAKEIYISEVIIASNSTTYYPRKLRIFVWEE